MVSAIMLPVVADSLVAHALSDGGSLVGACPTAVRRQRGITAPLMAPVCPGGLAC